MPRSNLASPSSRASLTLRFAPVPALFAVVFLAACSSCGASSSTSESSTAPAAAVEESPPHHDGTPPAPPLPEGRAAAVFAGGCFWCMEGPFEALEGVDAVLSGYAGGSERHPTYEQVSSGDTGHTEAVWIQYDPATITYAELLETYWHNVDAVDGGGQFCDRGTQYRPAIFPRDEEQRAAAAASIQAIQEQLGEDVAVRIEEHDEFWVAEGYHQDFYRTNPSRYTRYRVGCGRDARLQELWGEAASH